MSHTSRSTHLRQLWGVQPISSRYQRPWIRTHPGGLLIGLQLEPLGKKRLGKIPVMSADLRRLGLCFYRQPGALWVCPKYKGPRHSWNMSLPVIISSLFFLVLDLMVPKILRHTSSSKEIDTDSSLQPLPASMLQTPQTAPQGLVWIFDGARHTAAIDHERKC